MAQATDPQMQAYADQRVRVRAEQFRNLVNAMSDDRAAIDSVYDRAANGAAWLDGRTDGPPKLLGSQDILVYNAFAALFLKVVAGTATAQDVSDLHGNLAVFQSACVRPVQG